jgi:hypothetical protein
MSPNGRRLLLQSISLLLFPATAGARTRPTGRQLQADPSDYRRRLAALRPGDTLELSAGEYRRGLPLHGVVGSADEPIVIQGPPAPQRAVFVGRAGAHTVSLLDSAHVVLRDLVLDGRGARVDAVRAEGHARWAHHVTLERLEIVNHGASQQNSGISTKCPAWGWIVRDNRIVGAGTGMYFGDSDGSDPFFDSLIEGNRIVDPVGYGIQIKHQHDRPQADEPAGARATVVRHNVIVKRRVAPTPARARPSLLVGHLPLSGSGALDRHLVHDNLLLDNPSDALFQGEGNIAFFDNRLFNPRGEGVRIRPHNHRPREVIVFNNTIVAAALGITITGGEDGYERLLEHNLVYGSPPIRGEVDGDNVTGGYDDARDAFTRLVADADALDLTPSAALPSPRSRIDDRWLALAATARQARDAVAPRYGACAADAAGPCR